MPQIAGLMHLAFRRMLSDGTAYAVLLAGWVAAVALITGIPAYVDALNQRLLQNELQADARNRRPAFGLLFLSLDNVSGPVQLGGDVARRAAYRQLAAYMAAPLAAALRLPVQAQMHYARSDLFQLFPAGAGAYGRGDTALGRLNLGFIAELETQATLAAGHWPNPPAHPEQPIEVLASRGLANRLGLQIGERYVLYQAANPDPTTGERALALPVQIAGVWEAATPAGAFWYLAPSAFEDTLLTAPAIYLDRASARLPRPLFETAWYFALDGRAVRADNAAAFLQRLAAVKTQAQRRLPGARLILSPEDALLRYQLAVAQQSPILLILGLPVLALILLFIVLSAASLAERQRLDIATLRSRGASRMQVMGSYAAQGAWLSVAALALGLPGSLLAARLMGPAAAWLSALSHDSPALRLHPVLTPTSLLYAAGAVALANAATLWPILRHARSTVVQAGRRLARATAGTSPAGWLRDLLTGSAGLYGWYLLRTTGVFPWADRWQGVNLWENPLLFLTPCLWLWTGARLLLHALPLLCRGLDRLSRRLPGVTLLITLRYLIRRPAQYAPLLMLLMLTAGLGTFVASLVRTLDDNLADRALYAVGSSVAVAENAQRLIRREGAPGSGPATDGAWIVPPFDVHRDLAGVTAAARVGRFPVSVSLGNRGYEAVLYGIDRAEWPAAGFFRPDFAPRSLGALMNELALAPDGLLISRRWLDVAGYTVDDYIEIRGLAPQGGLPSTFRIVGALAYFPTAFPPADLFLVGNLDFIFEQAGGILPYHVWLRVDDPAVDAAVLRAALEAQSIEVLQLEDARAQLTAMQTQPARMGLFGFLALGFAATVLLSVLALAVHAALTLQRRRIQLGVLRALGWRQPQAAASLALEQLCLTGLGIGGGAGLGYAVSQIFIPFLQGGATPEDRVPPFIVRISWTETAWAAGSLFVAAALIAAAMALVAARTRIGEALKMGDG